MKIEVIKKRSHPIDNRYNVPTSGDQKTKLDQLKVKSIDVNEMTRQFWDKLITLAETGNLKDTIDL